MSLNKKLETQFRHVPQNVEIMETVEGLRNVEDHGIWEEMGKTRCVINLWKKVPTILCQPLSHTFFVEVSHVKQIIKESQESLPFDFFSYIMGNTPFSFLYSTNHTHVEWLSYPWKDKN